MSALALRDYQWTMVDYIIGNRRCNLLAGMGLGKTVSVLTALDLLALTDVIYPVLVLGPVRVIQSTWPDEIQKWPHLRHLSYSVIEGNAKERRAALLKPADIYLLNYENLGWLDKTLTELDMIWPFAMVVADECSKLKGYRTRQGAARAHVLGKRVHAPQSRYVGLTGTPASNGLAGFWGIMWFVDKGLRLGRSFSSFEQRWFRKGYDGYSLEALPHAQGEIQGLVKDVCVALNPHDYFDLADPVVNVITVDMPATARVHYDRMQDEMFTTLQRELVGDVDVEAFNAGAKMMNCRQLANGALYVDESKAFEVTYDGKIEALKSIVEDAFGAPVLVAYHFKSDLERLKKAFPKARSLDKMPQTIKDWNSGKIPVLFAHAASAGHGLNLAQGGNILAFFSIDWNLEEHLQIIERIGPVRQAQLGTGKNVFLHYIAARDTVDQMLMARLEGKKTIQQVLMEALKARKQ